MKDVFISYNSKEFDEANWVKSILETNGISCWMAPASIPGGSSYAVEIPQAIRGTKIFVLILSSKAQSSKWVSREVDLAINEGKIVLPFMLENCSLKDDFNFYLTNVQRYAAYENKVAAIEKMLREIKAVLGVTDAPVNADPTEKEPVLSPINEDKIVIEKKEKTKKQKAIKTKNATKSGKSIKKGVLGASIVATFVALIAIIVLIVNLNKVEIAGENFSKNEDYFYFHDITLTEIDVENFEKIRSIGSLHLDSCTIDTENLYKIVNRVTSSVKLDNCALTDADVEKFDFSNSSISTVSLSNNKELTDLSFVADLEENLYSLSFNNCSVENIDFLKNCTGLAFLNASGNKISNISVLNNSVNLYEIDLSINNIASIKAFANLNKLTVVNISKNNIKSLNGLENALELKEIYAANNQISDLNGISNSTVITKANFTNNLLTDLSLLTKSSKTLTELDVTGNSINDFSSIKACTTLTKLDIDNTKASNIDFIGNLTKLTHLYAAGNQISDISALTNCNNLRYIDLSDNVITTVSGLNFTDEVRLLDLSHNQITELKLQKNDYTTLKLYGNKISELSCLNEATGSTLIFDYNSATDYKALSNSKFYNYAIFNCPLDQQLSVKEALGHLTEFTTENDYMLAHTVDIYILNENNKKIHLSTCAGVKDIKESNKRKTSQTKDELLVEGYSYCMTCQP